MCSFALQYQLVLLTGIFNVVPGLMKMLGRWNWIIQETCPCGVVWAITLTLYSSGKMVNIKKKKMFSNTKVLHNQELHNLYFLFHNILR
jgi:hypothetical protein